MIITVTFNPSIDYVYFLEHFFVEGKHHRVENPVRVIGGKGINSARAMKGMGADVLALTTSGSTNGLLMEKMLEQEGLPTEFLRIEDETRVCMTFMTDQEQTELVEKGPAISDSVVEEMTNKIVQLCATHDVQVVTLNGSMVHHDANVYANLIETLRNQLPTTTRILADTSQPYLQALLERDVLPDFIKPNTKEISELIGRSISTKEEVVEVVTTSSLFNRIPFVLVSMGGDGAVAKIGNELYDVTIPKITIVNTTGSGDSTVAGVAYSITQQFDNETTLKYAMGCGMSNALHAEIGHVEKEEVEALVQQIHVTKLA